MPEDFDESVEGDDLKDPLDEEDFDEIEVDDESLDSLDPFAPEKKEEELF